MADWGPENHTTGPATFQRSAPALFFRCRIQEGRASDTHSPGNSETFNLLPEDNNSCLFGTVPLYLAKDLPQKCNTIFCPPCLLHTAIKLLGLNVVVICNPEDKNQLPTKTQKMMSKMYVSPPEELY